MVVFHISLCTNQEANLSNASCKIENSSMLTYAFGFSLGASAFGFSLGASAFSSILGSST